MDYTRDEINYILEIKSIFTSDAKVRKQNEKFEKSCYDNTNEHSSKMKNENEK